MNAPIPEYGAVPPVAETLTIVVPPLQRICPADAEGTKRLGCVIVHEDEFICPDASRTVTVYLPAGRLLAVETYPATALVQVYVNGARPPEMLTDIDPVEAPLHKTGFVVHESTIGQAKNESALVPLS